MAIKDDLCGLILQNLPHQPTADQLNAARQWASELTDPRAGVMLLTGYAGTGKTSLVGALVRAMGDLGRQCVLLAPTGRAAKVFAHFAGRPATTIHKRIYRQKAFGPDVDNFSLAPNYLSNALFVVDECSMIANEKSGPVLDDLMDYVTQGRGCRLLLVGDPAQLPPVGQTLSPALDESYLAVSAPLKGCASASLQQVVRQADESGILWNATALRQAIANQDWGSEPRLRISDFADVVAVRGADLLEALEDSYRLCGTEQTVVVTRSNTMANRYNNGIRTRILDYDDELVPGDMLVVVKNNYYWTAQDKQDDMPFIANGDVARLVRVRNHRDMYGFRFADATLQFPDYGDREMTVTINLDTLHAEGPALTTQQTRDLWDRCCQDWPELARKRRMLAEKVRESPYYNALQVKYAYAVTCHKAQGGQWRHVYVERGYSREPLQGADYYRWLYTALTRATERVYLVGNWGEDEAE